MGELGESGCYFETVQSIPFRTLCESLKDVLIDGIFKLSPNGISLVSMDNTKSIIVQMLLFKKYIERYECSDTYFISINLAVLYKVIKTLTTQDSVVITYLASRPDILTVSINSIEKRSKNKYCINLLKIDKNEELTFSIDKFHTIIQMSSYLFQKTCKDLLNTGGNHIEICTKDDSIIFKSNDNLLAAELSLYETNEGLKFKKKEHLSSDLLSYGQFKLRHLITFTKCTTLCPVVTLYLMEGYPIVLQYSVANLGIIRYCVASLLQEEIT